MAGLNTGALDPALRSAVASAQQQDTPEKPQQPLMSPWQRPPEQHPLPSLSRSQPGQAHHDHASALLAGPASAFSPQSTSSSTEAPTTARHRETQPSLYPAPPTLTPPDDPIHRQQSHDTPADHDHDDEDDDTHTPDDTASPAAGTAAASADAKKPRACESCRALKVRCDFPDPATSDPGAPCRRCARTKRRCVVTQPSRKRQRKTDTRVAELEKKIDALTASLVASRGAAGAAGAGVGQVGAGDVAGPGRGSESWEREGGEGLRYPIPPRPAGSAAGASPGLPPLVGSTASASAMTAAYVVGKKRKLDDGREAGEEANLQSTAAAVLAARDVLPGSNPFIGSDGAKEQLSPDVVEKGLLTMTQASELLTRYMTKMCPHLPAVVFPPSMTAAELRASKPILFLAVMAAASSESGALQQALTRELMQVLAERIIIRGNKTLEVVQAIQVAVIWYWPPDRFEDLKFYQLVHISAVMAIELGLGRRQAARGGFRKHISHAWRDHPLRKQPPPDPTTVEARRAWLTCYFMATNTAMALHRPNLIRWTPFVAESMDVLQTSPDAAPTDKYLCHLVWTHKLAEDVGIQFSMDDPASTPNLADPRTQHTLKGFERELERYRDSIPKEMQQPSLQMSFHVISLYMHEVVTHSDNSDDCRLQHPSESGFNADIPLSGPHINALSACLAAIDGIIGVFLSLDISTIRCLPVFNIVRVAYAVVVLIKIYFATCSPKSELGHIINKDDMKVEQHLDNLLEKFRATAAEGKSRPAGKFLVVLVMIRAWFHKHKQSQNGSGNQGTNFTAADTAPSHRGSSTPIMQQKQPQQQPGYASTPLHLLSEVATNKSVASSSSGARSSGSASLLPVATSASLPSTTADPWLSSRQQLMYDPITNSTTPPTSTANNTSSSTSTSFIPGMPPTPTPQQTQPQTLAQTEQDTLTPNLAFPWLSNAFNSVPDWDYGSGIFGVDGFAQAMDLTFGGFMDGGFGGGMDDGFIMANAMQEQGWFTPPPPAQGVAAGVAAGVGMEGDGGASVGGVGVGGEGGVAAAAGAGGYGF